MSPASCILHVLIRYTACTAYSGYCMMHTQYNILHALYSFTFKSRVNISSNETFEWDDAIKAWNWAREHEPGKIFLRGWRWGSISGGGFDVKVIISFFVRRHYMENHIRSCWGAIGGSEEASGNDENLISTIMMGVMGVVVMLVLILYQGDLGLDRCTFSFEHFLSTFF